MEIFSRLQNRKVVAAIGVIVLGGSLVFANNASADSKSDVTAAAVQSHLADIRAAYESGDVTALDDAMFDLQSSLEDAMSPDDSTTDDSTTDDSTTSTTIVFSPEF